MGPSKITSPRRQKLKKRKHLLKKPSQPRLRLRLKSLVLIRVPRAKRRRTKRGS